MSKNSRKIFELASTFKKKEYLNLKLFIIGIRSKYELYLLNINKILKNTSFEKFDKGLEDIQSKNQLKDAQFKKIVSDYLRLLEDYLFQIYSQHLEKEKLLFLLNQSRKLQDDSLYPYYLKRLDKLIKAENVNTKAGLMNQYARESIHMNYLIDNDQRSGDINIQSKSDSLDRFYIVEKLKLLTNAKTRTNSVKLAYNILFEEEIIEHIKLLDLENDFVIQFYYLQLKLVNLQDPGYNYNKLYRILKETNKQLSRDQISEVVIVMINTLSSIFSGQEYYKELMNLYKILIETNSILDSSSNIAGSTFKNVITVALNLNEIKWAHSFLNKYSKHLSKFDKNNVFYYNKATILFADSKFEEALEILNKCFAKDILITISVKRLYLKLFYELGEFDLVDSNTSSFNMYLRRLKSSSQNHVKYNKLFLDIYNQLFKLKIDPNTTIPKIESVLTRLKLEGIVPEKNWLIYQLEKRMVDLS